MSVHQLKTWPEPIKAIADGEKVHEVRKADRDFKPGDALLLVEWNPATERRTGRVIVARVGHVSAPGTWGLPADLCVMSLVETSVPRTIREMADIARAELQARRSAPAEEGERTR